MKTGPVAKDYKNCVYTIQNVHPIRYETAKIGRFCAPSGKAMEDTVIAEFNTQFNKYFGKYNVQAYLTDIISAREILMYTLLTGFFIGFVYMIFMRLFGGPLVYFSILGLILGTAYGGWMVYQSW